MVAGIIARANEDRAGLGIVMMLAAWWIFSFLDTSVKWMVLAGLPALQLAFMRYVGHFLLSLPGMLRGGGGWARFQTDALGLVLFRAFLLASATLLNFIALGHIPLTVVAAIMFTAPIFVSFLSGPFLGEHPGPWRWFAIVLGFVGALVVIRPAGEAFHWAMLLSVYNALSLALYSIVTRRLSGRVAAETMQFYMGAFGTAVFLPFAVVTWTPPTGALNWFLMIWIGPLGWAGHELMTRAHGFAAASTLMPFTYSFFIYLAISGYVVFSVIPDRWTLTGAGIIIFSGLLIWWRERKRGIGHG